MKTKLRKIVSVVLIAIFILSFPQKSVISYAETAYKEIDVTFNGSYLRFDVPAILDTINNRSLVPMRPIFEALGVPSEDINWNEETSSVSVRHTNGTTIVITVGSSYAYVNGLRRTLSADAINRNGRVYLPLRFICETLGATVYWNGEANTAEITL